MSLSIHAADPLASGGPALGSLAACLRPSTDARFEALVQAILDTRRRKGADYGDGGDSLANLRTVAELDVSPFLGVLVRMSDKWMRIKNLARKGGAGEVVDESLEDTLRDLAVYALLAILLWEDETHERR